MGKGRNFDAGTIRIELPAPGRASRVFGRSLAPEMVGEAVEERAAPGEIPVSFRTRTTQRDPGAPTGGDLLRPCRHTHAQRPVRTTQHHREANERKQFDDRTAHDRQEDRSRPQPRDPAGSPLAKPAWNALRAGANALLLVAFVSCDDPIRRAPGAREEASLPRALDEAPEPCRLLPSGGVSHDKRSRRGSFPLIQQMSKPSAAHFPGCGDGVRNMVASVAASGRTAAPARNRRGTGRALRAKDFAARVVVLQRRAAGGRVYTRSVSGFYIGHGYVATVRHFGLDDKRYENLSIRVYFASSPRSTRGHTVIRRLSDAATDTAFLQVARHHFGKWVPPRGSYEALRKGDAISCYGNTRWGKWLKRDGVVESASEVLTHSARISPGFSGGMVVRGDRVVAMTRAGDFRVNEDGFLLDEQSLKAHAIPIDVVMRTFAALRTTTK